MYEEARTISFLFVGFSVYYRLSPYAHLAILHHRRKFKSVG